MGTHPIFESDFDCLTEMGKLYSYADNFRADKIKAVAAISGYKLEIASDYVHGVTNKTAEFESKFFGKVPAFEDGSTALCNDNAIAHFVGNEQTRGGAKASDVLCWAGFADNVLLPAIAQWVWPTLGVIAQNKQHVSEAKESLKKAFNFMNGYLATCTFLVGERITYADIAVALTLKSGYEQVFTPEWRKAFPHVNRWFLTTINQPAVAGVVGAVKLAVKEAAFDAKKYAEVSGKGAANAAKKAAKKEVKKEKKAAAPAAAPAPAPAKEDKPVDPWAGLAKPCCDMDSWKRFYSNNDEDKSVEHFWANVVTDEVKKEYSLWVGTYKYADELTQPFMAANLIGGMFQRIEKLRKHAFANCVVGGKPNDLNITGLWFWRGQTLAFPRSPDWQIDYEVYDWQKLDWDAPNAKEMVAKYWMWDEKAEFGGKPFNQAKTYK